MEQRRRYPIGIQTFDNIIEGGYVYVDKTAEIYNLVAYGSKYTFLSRPRRFGKSLLVSTLKAYFEGRKELFEGLAISRMEKEWAKHPVLLLSLASVKDCTVDNLISIIDSQFAEYEKEYGVNKVDDLGTRLRNIVNAMAEKTGKKVVVLIDEYDTPILNVVHDDNRRNTMREKLQGLYGPIKDLDPKLRFVFITGITKFSQMSIFSALNNLENISMQDEYASIVGITKEEMLSQMDVDIHQLAKAQDTSVEETIENLRQHYDGYKFSKSSPDIFNPFSLIRCFKNKELEAFWFETGTPTYLIQMLRKFHVMPSEIGGKWAIATEFDRPTETMDSIVPLLYQSGYLTIKDYDPITKSYLLDIPNQEVRVGLMDALLPYYVQEPSMTKSTILDMIRALHANKTKEALECLKKYLGTVPYCDNTNYEGHWQQVLLIIFTLIGAYGDVEVRTPDGRIDFIMLYMNRLYLFEVKVNKSPRAAMAQIEKKGYAGRFANVNLPIIKVGINFSTKTRNITWLISETKGFCLSVESH